VNAGGGLIVDDADLSAATLLTTLVPLLSDRARLAVMADAAAAHGVRDADEHLARTVMGIASARRA
jgi:UDP-N-acetylglucosamine--N-acetylmuramyl-(pentapeptide) pyrophosphoryl-undecaprenol N-acetylglucosamine transferase